MNKSWVLVENGVISACGAKPYYWQRFPDTPPLDMLSMSTAELNALGWSEILETGRAVFDPEIQYEVAGDVVLIDGVAVREWTYPFLNGVVSVFLARNLRTAEKWRQFLISAYPGQSFEYDLIAQEASKFVTDTTPDPLNYPLLFSTLDKNLSPTNLLFEAGIEAAAVLSKRNLTMVMLAAVRSTRKIIDTKLMTETNPKKMLGYETLWNDTMGKFISI